MKVGIFFGGPSVEHDVSIISALQLADALESEGHEPLCVYLGRDGRWFFGPELRDVASFTAGDDPAAAAHFELGSGVPLHVATGRRGRTKPIDFHVAICAIHGTGGEDGALLGALELARVPYAGGGVGPAAVAMNKATAKSVFRDNKIDVIDHLVVGRGERPGGDVPLPCYVKPLSLGSSIGVSRCETQDEMEEALELALELDRRAMIEPALDSAREINCAVIGSSLVEPIVSECEEPVNDEAVLSFERKYMSGDAKGESGDGAKGMAAADRVIPAEITEEQTERVKETALRAHRTLGFAGVVRYDFLLDGERLVLNEANTVPGSFAFYLFEPVGLGFPQLADRLIEIALTESAEEARTTRTFESMLLERRSKGKAPA